MTDEEAAEVSKIIHVIEYTLHPRKLTDRDRDHLFCNLREELEGSWGRIYETGFDAGAQTSAALKAGTFGRQHDRGSS